ncbi:MAG: U32 family peptidase [Peptococcaceae bacterium]|nr:U32 family peptidase [Peptococcaceae bacterium]
MRISEFRKPELLAPAGDLEKLTYALAYGADAVYVGGARWGMRAYAGNFSLEQLRAGAEIAHRHKKKIYVTLNIFAHEKDFADLEGFLLELADMEIDGLIVSDPGIMRVAQRTAPEVPLHLSTQMNCTNGQSVGFWLDQGVQRVILARELSKDELAHLCRYVQGEMEIFVHGSMCMAYSGRCHLSHYLTGRDANHGVCTQPCRWQYTLVEEKMPNEHGKPRREPMPLEEDSRGTYILSSRDLCLLSQVPELARLGLASWKIEGRMKSLHYVARTVKVYREAIDTYWDQGEEAFYEKMEGWRQELDKVSHRPFTTGFFQGGEFAGMVDGESAEPFCQHTFVGRGLSPDECMSLAPEGAWVEQRNFFARGDDIEILSPIRAPQKITVDRMWDEQNTLLEAARHAKMKVRVSFADKYLDEFSLLCLCGKS